MKELDILKLFINSSVQFIFWKDINSIYQGCNTKFAISAGFSSTNEIVGKTDYDLSWSKEDADFYTKIDREIMQSGTSQLNFEEQQTQDDGKLRWLSTSKVPLFNDENEVIGILGWYNDITSYKTMEIQIDENNKTLFDYSVQLEKSKNDLESINRDLELFSYALSHDLKTPLNGIIGIAQYLQEENDAFSNEKEEEINLMITSAKKMNLLINDILNFARTGTENLAAENVNIKEIIEDKISLLDNIILSNTTKIDIQFKDLIVRCYPDIMGLLFFNLINNGLKYNHSNQPKIIITNTESDLEYIFSIYDNGIGINQDMREKVFQPFKRVSSDNSGSGLGLSICKRIAKMHKGRIWVEPNSNGGSLFCFTISKNL